MIEQLNTWFHLYMETTKSSPLMAAVSIPVVAGFLYFLRSLPTMALNFFLRMFTVRMTLNNAGFDGNIDAFNAFDKWYMGKDSVTSSRSFFLFRQYEGEKIKGEHFQPFRLGVGNGLHFFLFGKRLFWFTKGDLDSSGSERQKAQVLVTTLGFTNKSFDTLVSIFNSNHGEDVRPRVHRFNRDLQWEHICPVATRPLESVALDYEMKAEIIQRIKDFESKEAWYIDKGLTYKLSFIFKGKPGTGKTSFAKALAFSLNKDIFDLDLSMLTNEGLNVALGRVKPGSIVLIEDIDAAGSAVKSRDKSDDNMPNIFGDFEPLTLKGVLNSIDGLVALNDIILIATTNHPEVLSSALLRKARFDYQYDFKYLTYQLIKEYAQRMYGSLPSEFDIESDITLPGCDIESFYKDFPESPLLFLDAVRNTEVKLKAVV